MQTEREQQNKMMDNQLNFTTSIYTFVSTMRCEWDMIRADTCGLQQQKW